MVGHNLPPDCDWVNISENLGKAPCLPYLWLRLRNAYCPSIYTVKIGLIEMILLLYLLKILFQVMYSPLTKIIWWVKHMVFHTMVFQLCNMNHGLFQLMERTPWNQRYTLYRDAGTDFCRDLYFEKNQKLYQNQSSKWRNFAKAKYWHLF